MNAEKNRGLVEKSKKHFLSFWEIALGVKQSVLNDGNLHFSSSGFYISRDEEVIYKFKNYHSGSTVLLAKEDNINLIKGAIKGSNISIEEILSLPEFSNYELVFDDLDFFLEMKPVYKATLAKGLVIAEVDRRDQGIIDNFLKGCHEDDLETLDLNFLDPDVQAWAVMRDDEILGLGRYYIIPKTDGLMDITLLTKSESRGQGVATSIVEKIIHSGISKGYTPRYRVKTDNIASIKVAEKFGFVQYNHIQAIFKKDHC